MPAKKISELEAKISLNNNNLFLIENNNQTNQYINFQNLFNNIYEDIQIIILEKLYPIGYVYISTNNSNPKDLFNFGEWEQIKDTFLLGQGEVYNEGEIGGQINNKLTVNEMPNHQHQTPFPGNDQAEGVYTSEHFNFLYGKGQTASEMKQNVEMYNVSTNNQAEGNEYAYMTNFIGGNEAHNNMPPYLVVKVWKRIS